MGSRSVTTEKPRDFRVYTRRDLDLLPQLQRLPKEELKALKAVAAVLPFRVNNYVVEELICWDQFPEDPIFQLTFPQRGMLAEADFERMYDLIAGDAGEGEIERSARDIQLRMNPHPSGQMELNVPELEGEELAGMQHKYRETILFFPSQGQTCHAYCSYCFRWAQFIGINTLRFANREVQQLESYLEHHREINSVLLTGGDPLVMKTRILRSYIEPLLQSKLDHIQSIRLGTKSTAYWPYRFLTDPDADDLLRLIEEVRASGRHLALMAHYSHPRELDTPPAREAIRRIQDAGGVVRFQAPLIRHINDNPEDWVTMLNLQVRMGVVPYYMFVERDTGPRNYFEVPLLRALDIFQKAYRQLSGLGRTLRGPTMSATPGKVVVEGISTLGSEEVFVLKFIQSRDPKWTGRPFFARLDPKATWLDQLRPAASEREFFFEKEMRELLQHGQGNDRIEAEEPCRYRSLRPVPSC